MLTFRKSAALALALGLAACGPQPKFKLNVSLFPWIPHEKEFAAWIETAFEAKHPDIDLVIRPMELSTSGDYKDLSYEIPSAIAALGTETDPDFQHVVEVDTLILGKLHDAGVIIPFDVQRPDYLAFVKQAVDIGGRVYGVPHWTCGYFVMTTHADVATAVSATELRDRLVALNTPAIDLGGDIQGSWNSVISYLDGYHDTYPSADPAEALDDKTLDARVAASLTAIGDACTTDGKSYCDQEDGSMQAGLARRNVDALIGYSEALNAVLSDPGAMFKASDLKVSAAPMGETGRPYLFTDALVLSKHCATPECQRAAKTFAEFYTSNDVFEAAMMALDTPAPQTPRYLLPSREAAFTGSKVAADPIYQQLKQAIANARGYPNAGVPEAKEDKTIRTQVDVLLHPGADP